MSDGSQNVGDVRRRDVGGTPPESLVGGDESVGVMRVGNLCQEPPFGEILVDFIATFSFIIPIGIFSSLSRIREKVAVMRQVLKSEP